MKVLTLTLEKELLVIVTPETFWERVKIRIASLFIGELASPLSLLPKPSLVFTKKCTSRITFDKIDDVEERAILEYFRTTVLTKKKYFPDPIKECVTYKELGCAHVYGFLCNPKQCEDFDKLPEE